MKHTIGIAVLVLAFAVIGTAAAYNDDFGDTSAEAGVSRLVEHLSGGVFRAGRWRRRRWRR